MSSPAIADPTRLPVRRLLLRDGLVFLTLSGVSITLFVFTLLLFRSFEAHRDDLGRRWAARGEQALQQGHPTEAVTALRTALSYRDDLPAQLLLAQALAGAGRIEEATNYFLNLHETRPGDGFINLQLARLSRREGDAQQAIDNYRAAIFGDWQGDGALRRREVRFELADYLASRGSGSAARDELLIAAGNTPETAATDAFFGDRLAQNNDTADAFAFYTKALARAPHQRDILARAGRLAYTLGNYDEAARLLTAALAGEPEDAHEMSGRKELATLAANARRLPELSLSRELPAAERADHLLLAARIAQNRLKACPAAPGAPTKPTTPAVSTPPPAPLLQVLRSRWAMATPQLKKRSLERDAALEDNIAALIDDTETGTVAPCGPPQGDDALLLLLTNASGSAAH